MAGHQELFELFVRRVEDYAVYLLDPDGRVLTWNPGAERIKGYREAEIVGKHLSTFYPPEDKHVAAVALRTAAETGHFEAESWRCRKDGSRFWGAVSLTALRDDAGTLKGFAKITRQGVRQDHPGPVRAEAGRAGADDHPAQVRPAHGRAERVRGLPDGPRRPGHRLEPGRRAAARLPRA